MLTGNTCQNVFLLFYHSAPSLRLAPVAPPPTRAADGISADVSCTTAGATLNNPAHQFKLLPSGRKNNLPKCRTNGLECSLVPAAISLLNNVSFIRLFFYLIVMWVYCQLTQIPMGGYPDPVTFITHNAI